MPTTGQPNDQERIQGRWVVTESELDGKKSEAGGKGITWTFKGDVVSISSNRDEKQPFVLGSDKAPPTFDKLSSTKETYRGIYRLEDNTLTLCIANRGKERPKEFTSKNDQMLTTLRRQEKKPVVADPSAPPEKAVTDAEKKEFLDVLKKLPTEGEFFSTAAIKTAGSYLRVLLALTENDLAPYDIYAFAALSSGLSEYTRHREYVVLHFRAIAHPVLKLGWAVLLFNAEDASPEIVKFLKETLASKEGSKLLAQMEGPGFERFKKEVEGQPDKEE